MSLLYSGQIQTFTPKTYLDRTNLTPIPSPCPRNGETARQTVKELIARLSASDPLIYPHLASALRANNIGELWPPAKNRNEMASTYRDYMG